MAQHPVSKPIIPRVPSTSKEGTVNIKEFSEMVLQHKKNPKEWTVEKLAEKYKVDPTTLRNALKYTEEPDDSVMMRAPKKGNNVR
jgi:hypothetical protein